MKFKKWRKTKEERTCVVQFCCPCTHLVMIDLINSINNMLTGPMQSWLINNPFCLVSHLWPTEIGNISGRSSSTWMAFLKLLTSVVNETKPWNYRVNLNCLIEVVVRNVSVRSIGKMVCTAASKCWTPIYQGYTLPWE